MSVSNVIFSCLFDNCPYKAIPTSLRKHLKQVHKGNETLINEFNARVQATKAEARGSELFACTKCPQMFTSRGAVQNHLRLKHSQQQVDPTASPSHPTNPQSVVSSPSVPPASIASSPPSSPPKSPQEPGIKKFRQCTEEVTALAPCSPIPQLKPTQNKRLKCTHPDCNSDPDVYYTFDSRASMVDHFVESHGTDHKVEKSEFNSEIEFKNWLAQRQEETATSFIIEKTQSEGKRVMTYMKCKHEGSYERTGYQRFGHPTKKLTGEHKCTAYLKAIRAGDKVTVEACFQHFYHAISIPNLTLTTAQKEKIADLAQKGLSNKTIADVVKKESDEYSRLNYLNSDDVRNLKKAMNLNEEQYDNDDLRSVQKRYDLHNPADGIRLFNPPSDNIGSDFVMVIITEEHLKSLKNFAFKVVLLDDTHNVTRYRLKLTTLTVVDNFDRSEPAGFLISSSTTSKEVAMFFECVKKLFPNFRPYYMMTDEANCFWNGYAEIFDSSKTNRVLCRWHVYRAWKKNARKYLKDDLLKSTLRSMHEMIREPYRDKVIHRMLSLLTELDENGSSEAKLFAEYFRRYYYDKMDEWSAASRAHIACHTSMYAEAWHSVLKLERNLASVCPRKGLNRSKCREFEVEKGKFLIERDEGGTFSVSKIGPNHVKKEEYTVIDFGDCFCDKKENTHCDYCDVCAYRYWCDCLHSLAGVACIHMHGVLKYIAAHKPAALSAVPSTHCITSTSQPHAPLPSPNPPHFPSPPHPSVLALSPAESENDLTLVSTSNENDKEDNISKRMDSVKTMFDSIYAGLRQKMKARDACFEADLEKTEKALRALLNVSEEPALVARHDSAKSSGTARQVMHAGSLQKRQKRERRVITTSSIRMVPRRNISRCTICGQKDPPLPDDIDELEYESQFTDWKRCKLCKQPAHFSCTLSTKRCLCSENSSFELYPETYLEERDSDEEF